MSRAMIATLAVMLAAPSAHAAEVYFNGVVVTGLKNQSFEHCKVRFDDAGNVHITAKGYSVKRLDSTSQPPSPSGDKSPIVARKYFIYSRATRVGYAQYDIDVYINGKWIRKLRNSESQVVSEITNKLQKGKNVIHFAATKNYGGKSRLSQSASDAIQVFVGIGDRGGGTVNITDTLTSFKASAATTANFGQEQTIHVN